MLRLALLPLVLIAGEILAQPLPLLNAAGRRLARVQGGTELGGV